MIQNGVNGHSNGVERNGHTVGAELWRHPEPQSTVMHAFQTHVAEKYRLPIASYHDLWKWSVDHPGEFWEEIWHYTGIRAKKSYTKVRANTRTCTFGLPILTISPGSR